jgi:hypothetical protein
VYVCVQLSALEEGLFKFLQDHLFTPPPPLGALSLQPPQWVGAADLAFLLLEVHGPVGAALFHRCLALRMFINLAVVESKLGCGSVLHMSR